jgi:hypothetical protein
MHNINSDDEESASRGRREEQGLESLLPSSERPAHHTHSTLYPDPDVGSKEIKGCGRRGISGIF